jgi:hypothetical protein
VPRRPFLSSTVEAGRVRQQMSEAAGRTKCRPARRPWLCAGSRSARICGRTSSSASSRSSLIAITRKPNSSGENRSRRSRPRA